MEDLFAYLYSLVPLVNSAAFFPQVVKLYNSTATEAKSLSIGAWMIWLTSSLVTLLYGITNLHDPLFCFVASISVFWNVAVIALTLWKRRGEMLLPSAMHSQES